MKKRFWGIAAALVLALCLTQATALAAAVPGTQWKDYAADAFAGGTGTEADPYLIETPAQLAKLAKDVSNRQAYEGAYFRLEADLDLSAHRWNPIGTFIKNVVYEIDRPFCGILDGNGKKITGLIVSEMDGSGTAGLFGNIHSKTTGNGVGVRNLTIENAYVEATDKDLPVNYAGILAGWAQADDDCGIGFTQVTVSGVLRTRTERGYVVTGGLLGGAEQVYVEYCKVLDVDMETGSNAGGLVGVAMGGLYSDCRTAGKLNGTFALGGFVALAQEKEGSASGLVIRQCYADVDVSGSGWWLGGFAGSMYDGEVSQSVAMGDVESSAPDDPWDGCRAGGFFGQAEDTSVSRSHAAGKVTAKGRYAGGFIGTGKNITLKNRNSHDGEKNPGIAPIGEEKGSIQGTVSSETSQKVLSNICEDYYYDEGGHLLSDGWIVDREPTCAEEGLESKHCERCDEHGAEEIIPKTDNHQFEWVIDRQPAVGVAGSKHEECKACGLKKDPVEIPALSDGSYDVPRTGDQAHLLLWAAALLLGTGLLIGAKKKAHN